MRALVANAVGSSVRRKRRAQQAVAVGDKCSSEESGERLGMRAVATVGGCECKKLKVWAQSGEKVKRESVDGRGGRAEE